MTAVMTMVEARAMATRLVTAVHTGQSGDWRAGLGELERLGGREWLLLDQAARRHVWSDGTPASGVRGWLGPELDDPSGFVAIVTSFHVDGRFRERATRVLASKTGLAPAAALAVRMLDHVPQVRTQAWDGLRPVLGAETAAPVLDVLLAGRDRQHGPHAFDYVAQYLSVAVPDATLLGFLADSGRRAVRRWAFEFGHDRGLLTTDTLIEAACGDSDQWVQAICAEWLMREPDAGRMDALLRSTSVEARLVGLTRIPDDALDSETLERLILDRAPRVREQARWRARRRDIDLAGLYRATLAADPAPRVVAACLDGLAETGDASDLGVFVTALGHPSPRVRAAAVAATASRAGSPDAVRFLVPRLLDASPRVATAAARSLAGLNAGPELADEAWASPQAASRRAAWRLARSAGGWDRVEADLRAAADPDPGLSGLGRDGVVNWLEVSAATTWGSPASDQRRRIEGLLAEAGLTEGQRRLVAFCAGSKLPPQTAGQAADRMPADAPGPTSTTDHNVRPSRPRRGLLRFLGFR